MDSKQMLFALIRIAVCGEPPREEVRTNCTPQMLRQVYALGAKHDLAHLIGQGASKLQLPDSPELEMCKKAAMTALVRQTQQEYDLQKLFRLLEDTCIFFLPLKGAVLRSFYPEPWQRTSCDIDIMVKKEDIPRATALLKGEGWTQWEQSSNEITFVSKGKTVLELHHGFMDAHVELPVKALLEDIWQYTRPVAGAEYHMELPEEWLYCCHLAHMAKHIVYGGCGIRPFLDLWIMHKKTPRIVLPEGSGLEVFAHGVNKLAQIWFGDQSMDEPSEKLQEFILSGGTYGSLKNQVKMQQQKKGGKGNYLISRIFPPIAEMCGLFPILQKRVYLLPAFYIVRWCRLLFTGKWKKPMQELELLKEASDVEELITYLGL